MLKFSTSTDSKYVAAARTGDAVSVEEYINNPANANNTDEHFKALIKAINSKHLNIVKLILDGSEYAECKRASLFDKQNIKDLVYAVLRCGNIELALCVIHNSPVKAYLANVFSNLQADLGAIKILDLKIQSGNKRFICEIAQSVEISRIMQLPTEISLCSQVLEVINVESKFALFHYAVMSKKIKDKFNVPSELVLKIFEFALDYTVPLSFQGAQKAAYFEDKPKNLLGLKPKH